MKTSTLNTIGMLILIYLFFSLCEWNLYPGAWNGFPRTICAIIMLVIIIVRAQEK